MFNKEKEILEKLNDQLKSINNQVFYLRVKSRRVGLNNLESYRYRVLKLKQGSLRKQVKGLENKIGGIKQWTIKDLHIIEKKSKRTKHI